MVTYEIVSILGNTGKIAAVLDLLQQIFGEEEALLARRQLLGAESKANRDTLFVAWQNGLPVGTCHLTVALNFPQIGALSGMGIAKQYRGRGLGRILFEMALETFDQADGEMLFLGTSNPLAARMYSRAGFAFAPGSQVMYRSKTGSLYDFYRRYYGAGPLKIQRADAAFRLPVIPLVLPPGRDLLLDINTAVFSTAFMTQVSCMGLYPRYLKIIEKGGAVWGAVNQTGALCALGSAQPTAEGTRIDAFNLPGFEEHIPLLLEQLTKGQPDCYAEVAAADNAKAKMFSRLGYQRTGLSVLTCSQISVSTEIWRAGSLH